MCGAAPAGAARDETLRRRAGLEQSPRPCQPGPWRGVDGLRYHPGMNTLTVEFPKDLKQHVGRELGPSDWVIVEQGMIDRFAEATGDHQWIHVDVERAKHEFAGREDDRARLAHALPRAPHGPDAAQGLEAGPRRELWLEQGALHQSRSAGARIRLRQRLVEVEDVAGGGVRITSA
jgi:hypothetical protein